MNGRSGSPDGIIISHQSSRAASRGVHFQAEVVGTPAQRRRIGLPHSVQTLVALHLSLLAIFCAHKQPVKDNVSSLLAQVNC